jgi:thioester reductase-like protein
MAHTGVDASEVSCGIGGVLITGATGYLGSHLLHHLLTHTRTPIYCLARSNAKDGAYSRVLRALNDADDVPPRIDRLRIFDADLSRPKLGLSNRRYAAIADDVSTIVHCAADVSWSSSYAKLHPANVIPVAHLLQLAAQGCTKHFALISSMAVCYSTDPSLYTHEGSDPSTYLSRIPLGYAQSKAMAERLVRDAAARGMSATIFRPALIAGHTSGGRANAQDFISWLVSGCVRMGWAPDADWRLDIVPVDYVSAAIAANLKRSRELKTLHIAHPQPRAWREVVLLLNLNGYEVRLESFERWLERLVNFPDKALPLRRFIGFFAERAQVYEANGSPRISNAQSAAHLNGQGLPFPQLSAKYFSQYLSSLVEAKLLQPSRALPASERSPHPPQSALQALKPLGNGLPANAAPLRIARFEASGSISAEITSWRYGGAIGLYGIASSLAPAGEADLILKIAPTEQESVTTTIDVAASCKRELGSLVGRFSRHLDFPGANDRETFIYGSDLAALTLRIPRCYATGREPASGRRMLLLENLAGTRLLNCVDRPELWVGKYIATAIRDLAAIHAPWYDAKAGDARVPSAIRHLDAAGIVESSELWQGLFDYGRPFFAHCGGIALTARIEALVRNVAQWIPDYGRHPLTLVHNDCNPRNMAFKHNARALSTCLYDWELCTLAPPQRDLAELLCFTLRIDNVVEQAPYYIELHRRELSKNIGRALDVEAWNDGFRLALADVMLRRLSLYAMLHSLVRQSFLPRVVKCWQALDHAMH